MVLRRLPSAGSLSFFSPLGVWTWHFPFCLLSILPSSNDRHFPFLSFRRLFLPCFHSPSSHFRSSAAVGHFPHIKWQQTGRVWAWGGGCEKKKRASESRGKNPQVEKGGTYSEIERLGRNVTRWGGEWEKKWIYLRDGLLLLNAPLRHHPLPSSSPLLPLPPPQGSRRRYEKVIMFPLEMACSPSTPFISKWNNLSTVACLFFSLHLHLSFQYTTHTPAVSFPFLSVFFFHSPQLPSISLIHLSLLLFFFFFFVVLSIVGALCCRYMPYQSVQLGMVLLPHSSAITLSSYHVKYALGVCVNRL